MTWQQWVLVGIFGLSGVASAALVGKRPPERTATGAAVAVIINGLLIWMVATL